MVIVTLLVVSFAVCILPSFIRASDAAPTDWTLVTDARAMKAYPDLREYVWQKTPLMLPNGPYDKIALHRLVKTGVTTKAAVFILAASYGSGEQLISNPLEDNYSIDESSNTAMYWANRGFDVYSIDYRAHFLPLTFNATQASAITSNWGWDVYISDIKEAVDQAKAISGYSKVFLAGISLGGNAAMYYASKYWNQDLKGIILLDASEQTAQSTRITNKSNVTSSLNSLNASGRLALEYPNTPGSNISSGALFAYQYALQNPGAPAQYPPGTPLTPTVNPLTNRTWTNITEFFAYGWYSSNFSNVYAGYGNNTANLQRSAAADRYLPMRLFVENTALHDWNNCPYISYDFDDHYKEINLPVLGFRSTLFGIPTYGNFTNGLATTDFAQITLPNYGHLDVVTGKYSAKDVSEPAYQWMLSHLSTLDVTARTSVTVLPGWTWWFYVQNLGGSAPYTYQWYEGMNPIQGQTSMVLPVTKTAPGVYSFYCRVTDKDGTSTTSNAVTMAVMG